MNNSIMEDREPLARAGAPSILEVEHLSKTFSLGRTPVPVLMDVNVRVGAGESVSIIGASGAGKSTLLHIIGGLDHPTSGSVIFDGQDMYKLSARKRTLVRGRRIGFVFQFYYLLPELDVLENVMLPTMNEGLFARARRSGGLSHEGRSGMNISRPGAVKRQAVAREAGSPVRGRRLGPAWERAMALLEIVGLADRAGHLPSELSGGEHQRAALARALMNEPDLLLADEPTGNLDSVMGDAVMDCMCALIREKGSTLIMVTHNPAVAGRCDRVLKLEDGCLASC